MKLKILFDFDGTLCKVETISLVASTLHLNDSGLISQMTGFAIHSSLDYEKNLTKRIEMMKGLSINDFVESLPPDLLRTELVEFIDNHRNLCAIASCNLDCWAFPITSHLRIPCHFSKAIVSDGHVLGIEKILDKAKVVEEYQRDGFRVIFVGDSANDLNAMAKADMAFLLYNGTLDIDNISDKINVIFSEKDLINQLEAILQ